MKTFLLMLLLLAVVTITAAEIAYKRRSRH